LLACEDAAAGAGLGLAELAQAAVEVTRLAAEFT